jgi:hypothetical protein
MALPLMPLLGGRISIAYVVDQSAIPLLNQPGSASPGASP